MNFLELTKNTIQDIHNSSEKDNTDLTDCGPHVLTLLNSLTSISFDACTTKEIDSLQTLALELQKTAHQKIHTYPFSSVPLCWRRLYTDAGIILAILLIWAFENSPEPTTTWDDTESQFIKYLDMVLIMTGAPGSSRESTIHTLLASISTYDPNPTDPHPSKRVRLTPPSPPKVADLRILPSSPTPELKSPIPRYNPPSLPSFQAHMNNTSTDGPTPFIITNLATSWPAFNEHPWWSTEYLLSVTNNGKRLVPVEIGEAYTSEDWGQQIITFREFLDSYILNTTPAPGRRRGYLAQHGLLRQIPALRKDILIPDYCYISPKPPSEEKENEPEADSEPKHPLLNTWFGPPSTISPLHTDPHHNILLNIFGRKYIRLYPPSSTARLFPRSTSEDGIDMSNTSSIPWEMVEGGMDGFDVGGVEGLGNGVEVDDVLRYWDEGRFGEVEYLEAVLGEGEGLFLPRGWWHYVRGLETCFSVSMWWD